MKITFDSEEEKQKKIDFHTKMVQYHQSRISKYVNAPVSNKAEDPPYLSFDKLWDTYPKKKKKALSNKRWEAMNNKQKKILWQYVTTMSKGEWSGKDPEFIQALAYLISGKDYLDPPSIERPVTMSESPPHHEVPVAQQRIDSVSDEEGKENAAKIMAMLQHKSID